MNREEFKQARHDYRVALKAISNKHEIGSLAWDRAFNRIYKTVPFCIRNSFRHSKYWLDAFKPWSGSVHPHARWFSRCTIVPNSYPRETKNP